MCLVALPQQSIFFALPVDYPCHALEQQLAELICILSGIRKPGVVLYTQVYKRGGARQLTVCLVLIIEV